jgi:predicted MPP superfamily phosphohydrolase
MMKLRASGRGKNFSAARGFMEWVQETVYAGAWPARLLQRLPFAHRVQQVRHAVAAGRAGRPALRLAFVSDLHIGPLTPPRLLEEAFRLLAASAPDVLVLGGDYVSLEVTPRKAGLLERLVASVPAATKLAVLGNHDLWTDNTVIERALHAAGARVLVNQAARLPSPHEDVAVVGLDDPWTGHPDPDRAFGAAGDAPVRIAVAHAPEAVPHVQGRGAALMLCGHTHGGQVALPSGPVVVHGPLGRRWPGGLYDADGVRLFVSRGLGTVDLPLRAWAPSDVSSFEIT